MMFCIGVGLYLFLCYFDRCRERKALEAGSWVKVLVSYDTYDVPLDSRCYNVFWVQLSGFYSFSRACNISTIKARLSWDDPTTAFEVDTPYFYRVISSGRYFNEGNFRF